MKVRRYERFTADMVMDVFNYRLSNRHSFTRRRPASQLVDDDQASRRCFLRHYLDIRHFDHKRALPADQIVRCANPGKNSVDQRYFRRCCRHEAADLRQDRNEGDLAHIRAFSRHIRPGNE
ncbi:hypothetical protein D3C77_491840 [compost metagenome]